MHMEKTQWNIGNFSKHEKDEYFSKANLTHKWLKLRPENTQDCWLRKTKQNITIANTQTH